jgi:hypothetical protein
VSFSFEKSAAYSVQKSGANVRSPPTAVDPGPSPNVCSGGCGDRRLDGYVGRKAGTRDSQKETYGTGEVGIRAEWNFGLTEWCTVTRSLPEAVGSMRSDRSARGGLWAASVKLGPMKAYVTSPANMLASAPVNPYETLCPPTAAAKLAKN